MATLLSAFSVTTTDVAEAPAGGRCGTHQIRGTAGHVAVGGFEGVGHLRVARIHVGAHSRAEAGLGAEPSLEEPDLLVGVGRQVRGDGPLLVGQGNVEPSGPGGSEGLAGVEAGGHGRVDGQ